MSGSMLLSVIKTDAKPWPEVRDSILQQLKHPEPAGRRFV
jgi:hypothetical protein